MIPKVVEGKVAGLRAQFAKFEMITVIQCKIMIDNFILKLTWAGLECNVKEILKIEIFGMIIKCRGKKYSSYITKVGNCRISPFVMD